MLPGMKYADKITKSQQVKFGGLNRSVSATDGEFSAMRNLTSDHFPVMACRRPRVQCRKLDAPGGLFSWEGLCWVDGTDFYFEGEKKGTVSEGKKVFASLGSYVVIFPDKCWYNVDSGAFGSLESRWEGESLVFGEGEYAGAMAAANAIYCVGVKWEDYFKPGDAVTISGCTIEPGNNKTLIIREIQDNALYFYENSFTVSDPERLYTEEGALCIERTVPDLKYVCENEGRLWGCNDTTIYACKLGDIFNWNSMDGLDEDSWAVDSGSAGVFTGCVSYRGYPTFFKEDHIYKVYGSFPSNFEVLGSSTLGLLKGCADSLAVAGETLFYLSRNGIMAYTGGIPQPMGVAFGTDMYKNAVAGSDGLKYYASMQGQDDAWGLYVYDTQSGLWCQEDQTQAVGFSRSNAELYMLDVDGRLWIVTNPRTVPDGAQVEESVQWEAEFADFTDGSPNAKGLSKLQIRLELEAGAEVTVWLQLDSDGQWQKVHDIRGETKKRSCYIPIIPRRADHYRLKLTGVGGCKIYSLTREFYVGSELRTK